MKPDDLVAAATHEPGHVDPYGAEYAVACPACGHVHRTRIERRDSRGVPLETSGRSALQSYRVSGVTTAEQDAELDEYSDSIAGKHEIITDPEESARILRQIGMPDVSDLLIAIIRWQDLELAQESARLNLQLAASEGDGRTVHGPIQSGGEIFVVIWAPKEAGLE